MKKLFTVTLLGLTLSAILSACKSSSGGHCDAYGSLDKETPADVASK
jgi:hypothetical protein